MGISKDNTRIALTIPKELKTELEDVREQVQNIE